MAERCQRCYQIVAHPCQSEAEWVDCPYMIPSRRRKRSSRPHGTKSRMATAPAGWIKLAQKYLNGIDPLDLPDEAAAKIKQAVEVLNEATILCEKEPPNASPKD